MAFLFNVRRPDGKLAAQCTSRKLAAREIKWLTTSGFAGPYLIERIERTDCARWGYGLPNRFAAKWPPTKLLQFGKYYLRGDRVIDLADYFGTNVAVVCKMARRLGFGRAKGFDIDAVRKEIEDMCAPALDRREFHAEAPEGQFVLQPAARVVSTYRSNDLHMPARTAMRVAKSKARANAAALAK